MPYWSKNIEKRFIRAYPSTDNEELAKIFKVSYQFVARKAEELGLEKDEDKPLTHEQVSFIQANYENKSNNFLADVLDIPKWKVEHIAYRIGLRKSKEYLDVPADDNDLVSTWESEWNKSMGCSKGHYVTGKILQHLFPYHRVVEEESIGKLWIDWLIPQLSIAVEVHGEQHTSFNAFFHKTKNDFVHGQENDYKKSEMLESQNISLIVVYHDEKLSINLINKKLEEII